MKKILIVAKETFFRQIKSWGFIFMVLGPFIIVGINIIIGLATAKSAHQKNDTDNRIAVVCKDNLLKTNLKANPDVKLYDNQATASKLFEKGKIKGYLYLTIKKNQQLDATVYLQPTDSSNIHKRSSVIISGLQNNINFATAKLSNEQKKKIMTVPEVHIKQAEKSKEIKNDTGIKIICFYAVCFILYFILLIYNGVTTQEIATEKGTKIMEVVFSSMPGGDYFIGKIMGLVGEVLLHIGIYLVGGYSIWRLLPYFKEGKTLVHQFDPFVGAILGNIGIYSLIYVVAALIICLILAALCGALASKPENAGKTAQFMTILIILCFILATQFNNNVHSNLLFVLSYVPFISSFMMPIRIIYEVASTWEILISISITVGFLIGILILIRRIYPRLILQTDDSVFKALKKAMMK